MIDNRTPDQQLADANSYSRDLMDGYKDCQRCFIEVSKLIVQFPPLFDTLSPETRQQVFRAALCDVPAESDKT